MAPNGDIKVAIADDHRIFRQGVISSLGQYEGLRIVCEAESGEDLLTKLIESEVDVILLDMRMPGMDGIEVCRKVKKTYPGIAVIGLSVYDHIHYVSGLFEAGASGYLLKDVEPAEIVLAIRSAFTDGAYINEKAPLKLVKNLIEMDHPSVYFDKDSSIPLKASEIEILRLIAGEFTNNEIAGKLSLGKKTIENYRNNLLQKTGARNTAGLVTYAIKKGLVIV